MDQEDLPREDGSTGSSRPDPRHATEVGTAEAADPEVLPTGSQGGRSRSRRPLAIALLLVAVAAVGGAWALASRDGDQQREVSAGGDPAPATVESGFWGRRWVLRSIEGPGAPAMPAPGRSGPLTLDLGVDGRVSYNGCNGGAGTARIEEDTLVIVEDFMSTAMACEDADGKLLMAYDTWMGDLLNSRPTLALSASSLVVSSAEGTATFGDPTTPQATTAPDDADCAVSSSEATGSGPGGPTETTIPPGGCRPEAPVGTGVGPLLPPTPPGPTILPGPDGAGSPGSPGAVAIWGSRWTVTSATIRGEQVALVPSQEGQPLRLDAANGTRVSFNGCNGGSGDARLVGDRLVFDGIASTRMACAEGAGAALMAQDRWMTELLEAGPVVSVEGDTLTLATETATLTATRGSDTPTSRAE